MGDSQKVASEFSGLDFGDQRLNKRYLHTMEKLNDKPEFSIHGACGSWAESMAAYRLFENDKVTSEEILASHRSAVVNRMSQYRRVFVLQDTTGLSYGSHIAVEDLGSLAQGSHGSKAKGLFVHSALVLGEQGVPLGLLGQIIWSRAQLTMKDDLFFSEFNRWMRLLEETLVSGQLLEQTQVITVTDREASFNEFIELASSYERSHFIVRAKSSRTDKVEKENLAELREKAPLLGEVQIKVPAKSRRGRSKNRKTEGGHPKRLARVQIRSQKNIQLKKDLFVNAVWVELPPARSAGRFLKVSIFDLTRMFFSKS